MKPGKMQPHMKLREAFALHPGWYWDRHMCEVVLPDEVLRSKPMRCRRADWDGEYHGTITVEWGRWLYYYICPVDNSDLERQRVNAHHLQMKRSHELLMSGPFAGYAQLF